MQQLRNDSVAKVPLIVKSFKADQSNLQFVLDSNSSLLQPDHEYNRSLNNFYSPQFRLSNVKYGKQIYENGINSMNYPMSGFDNFTFLAPNKPVAEIATHRGRVFVNSHAGFQDNFDIHLIFAENFRNRVLWNFSYDRNDHLGIYTNGLQESSLFTTGVQYSGKNEKFHLNVLYIDERHTIQDNWGIPNDSLITDPNYSIREAIPVNISSANTEIGDRSIGFNLDFPVFDQSELLKPVLFIKSFYTNYSFHYVDPSVDSSQGFYKSFWVDSFSISNLLNQKIWTNSVGLQLFTTDKIESRAGIRYEHNLFDHDTLASTRDVFQLETYAKYRLDSTLELRGAAYLKRFENSFAPDIQIDLQIMNPKYFNCKLAVFLKSDPIPYIYQHLVLNKKNFWDNSFEHRFIQEAGFAAILKTEKVIHSTIHLSWSNFNNFIYLDTISYPVEKTNINKFSIKCYLPIKYKWLQLNSQFNYDLFNPDPGNFSGWHSFHRLSLNRTLFKKVVNADLGATLHLYDYKNKLQFNPLIQLFHASAIPNEMIYSVGLFMHFQISNFKLLVDIDNLDSFWVKQRPSLVESYPFYDFYFKFGLQWKFLN